MALACDSFQSPPPPMSSAPAVSPLLQQRRAVERQLSMLSEERRTAAAATTAPSSPRGSMPATATFDFLSLRDSMQPAPLTEEELRAQNGPTPAFLHAQAAAQDAATTAINAERILREALAASQAEAEERAKARKRERKVRYVMADSDPLVRACKRGDDTRLRELLALAEPEELVEYVNARDKNGSTAIFHTVWPGHLEALRILLENGANPNHQNNRQNTALHLACEREHMDLILLLIQFGASITLLNLNGQRCYQTLADQAGRSRSENFCKRALNDVRRGQALNDDSKFRITISKDPPPFWSRDFYARNFYEKGGQAKMAQLKANLDPESELYKAAVTAAPVSEGGCPESASKILAAESNQLGVPDVSPQFKMFVARNLKHAFTSTFHRVMASHAAEAIEAEREEARANAEAAEASAAEQRMVVATGRKKKRADTAFFAPQSSAPAGAATISATGAHRRRRSSTGDIAAARHSAVVASTLRSLELCIDLDPAQKQQVAFMLLMHPPPTRMPLPPPLPEMPAWLDDYTAAKQQTLSKASSHPVQQDLQPLTSSHAYALTRLRTAAFASASSPLLNATIFASSRTEIPHSHKPDIVKPVCALLKDFTVHLPTSTVRPSTGARRTAGSPTRNGHTGPTGVNGVASSWDSTAIALDRQQSSNILKHPAYSNWVLRQLSAVRTVAAAAHTSATGSDVDTPESRAALLAADDLSMHVRDQELFGLIDAEVESFIHRTYGAAAQQARRQGAQPETTSGRLLNGELHPLTHSEEQANAYIRRREGVAAPARHATDSPSAAHSKVVRSKVPLHLANLVTPPVAPSARLHAEAALYLDQEKEQYLSSLYRQVHSVLATMKKSNKLYIAPSLARKLKQVRAPLFGAWSGSSKKGLNSGGMPTEYTMLGFEQNLDTRAIFEAQVRDMIEERKRERVEQMQWEANRAREEEQLALQAQMAEESKEQLMLEEGAQAADEPEGAQHTDPAHVGFHTPTKGASTSTMQRSASGKKLGVSMSAASIASSSGSGGLHHSQSESVLTSAALQRALVQSLNPRTPSTFSGGGPYERKPSPATVNGQNPFKLASPSPSKATLPKLSAEHAQLDLSHAQSDVQVMQIAHSSEYATWRATMQSRSGGRPSTANARAIQAEAAAVASRPQTSGGHAPAPAGLHEWSLSQQQLVVPDDAVPNVLLRSSASMHSLRSPPSTSSGTRAKSSAYTSPALAPNFVSSFTPSQATAQYMARNPTARPPPLGHPSAVERPSSAAAVVAVQRNLTGEGMQRVPSAARLCGSPVQSPVKALQPSSSVSALRNGPLFTAADQSHSHAAARKASSSMSARIGEAGAQQISAINSLLDSPSGHADSSVSLLRTIRAKSAAASTPTRSGMRHSPPASALAAPLSPGSPSFSVGMPAAGEEKEEAGAQQQRRAVVSSFASGPTSAQAQRVGLLSGSKASLKPRIGYSQFGTPTSDVGLIVSRPTSAMRSNAAARVGDEATTEAAPAERASSASPSRAQTNLEKAIAKRTAHTIRVPGLQPMHLTGEAAPRNATYHSSAAYAATFPEPAPSEVFIRQSREIAPSPHILAEQSAATHATAVELEPQTGGIESESEAAAAALEAQLAADREAHTVAALADPSWNAHPAVDTPAQPYFRGVTVRATSAGSTHSGASGEGSVGGVIRPLSSKQRKQMRSERTADPSMMFAPPSSLGQIYSSVLKSVEGGSPRSPARTAAPRSRIGSATPTRLVVQPQQHEAPRSPNIGGWSGNGTPLDDGAAAMSALLASVSSVDVSAAAPMKLVQQGEAFVSFQRPAAQLAIDTKNRQ